MRKTTNRNRAIFAACEALEERRLFVAFQLYVDGNPVPGPTTVNYGTVPLNSNGPSHTFSFKSLNAAPFTVSAALELGEFGNDWIRSGDGGSKILNTNQSYTVSYKLVTTRTPPGLKSLNFRYSEPDNSFTTKTFTLTGNILPSEVNSDIDFGSLTNANKASSGELSAISRVDDQGATLEQVSPYLAALHLPAANTKVDLSVIGTSLPLPDQTEIYASGKMNMLLVEDANGDGKLSIAERENPIATLTTDLITKTAPSTKTTAKTLGSGEYLIFLSITQINTGFTGTALKFDMSLKVDDIAPPAFEVRGDNVVINDNDTTPSPDDGTRFDTVDEGDAATLTFSVKNTGEATMNIDGQRPNVTGDFIIFEDGLNSTIAAGASDTFKVKLINTTPGEKSGTIEIQSSNAQGGSFTFKIGGTVAPTPPPPPEFAVLSGSTLTVTGTSGNDAMTSTIDGSTFKFTRSGVDSSSFATSAVSKVVINLLDGNDSYSSATQLDIKQTINGGNGNDLIRGGKQADVMNGNDGDDRMDGRTRGDLFDGGAGSDTAVYRQRRATEPVTVTIDELANDGGSSDQSKDNVLSSTEHIQGGLGNDRLTGSSKTNRLFGFEGDDTIAGLKGNDTLDGGAGANDLNGGFGNDQFFSRNAIADIIDGGADTDSLTGDTIDNFSNVENPSLA